MQLPEEKNYEAYHKQMDAILAVLTGKADPTDAQLTNFDKKVAALADKYAGDETLGRSRYKLFLAQSLLFLFRSDYDKTTDYLRRATELYGGAIPGMGGLYKIVVDHIDKQPAPYERYPVLHLTRHTGMVLAWQQQSYQYQGPPELLRPKYYKTQGYCVAFGWWSPMSLFINPIVILANLIRWLHFRYKCRDIQPQ